MANDLTGDFDVVAEFAASAANRVLAAMHRSERFLHSMAMRVDDNPPPGSLVSRPSVVGSVDMFGDATVNHHQIGTLGTLLGQFSPADPVRLSLDPVVNTDLVSAPDGPIAPSHFQGRAQLQLSPPRIEVSDGSGKNITVKLRVMSRYFPEPHTSPAAEFVRGELQITAPVDQVASPDPKNVRMVDVDIKGKQVTISFNPESSSRPLSAEDLAGINLLIRNALKTSFLPSSNQLPDNVNYAQFKTLLGPPNAIALLLNIAKVDPATGNSLPPGNPGNPATLNNVFLLPGDDFAIAVGKEPVLQALNLQPKVVPGSNYTISTSTPTVEFQDGQILVTVNGHAQKHHWYLINTDFEAKQALTLEPVATKGGGRLNTAQLALKGDISLTFTNKGIAGAVKNLLLNLIKPIVLRAISGQIGIDSDTQKTVEDKLDVDENLGKFLNSLLKPPRQQPGTPPPQEVSLVLAYTSVAINLSGIVLHGSVAVPDWPPAHVEFQQIPSTAGGGRAPIGEAIPHPPDYSALRTWIPGGTIQQYEWSYQGQTQAFIDKDKFVWIHPPPQVAGGPTAAGPPSGGASAPPEVSVGPASTGAVSGFIPICLTVRGVRLSSSGPEVEQSVSASVCGYTRVSILEGVVSAAEGALLMVALAQPGPGGLVQVAGHASAQPDGAGGGALNRIVHFANERTAGNLEFLLQALRESGRRDATTAVVAVLTRDLLTKAPYTEGVIYAEDQGGDWARALGVETTRRPVTRIVLPQGNTVWQHEGEPDSATLAAALRKNLAAGGPVSPRILWSNLRIGWRAPNFLFELAPGRGLTLRKLVGREVVLVFCKCSLEPSIEAVRDLQKPARQAGAQEQVVLAIHDGEARELVKKVAVENRLSTIPVPDPKRSIALAYGVNIWPMIFFLDVFGVVREIRYGRFAGEHVEYPSRQKAAPAR